jgi:phenylpropionate dioxygenase-like ring-hydroxylating dioxygenase large terminal subunit
MFEGFARVWTPVAVSYDLRADKPLGVKVAGTGVVLFRDQQNRPVALVDRCPHRGVALSLGVVKNGCVECPFHGWQINGQGQTVHVPWNPDAKLETLHGTPIPARELGGQIWIYTAPGEQAPSEPEVHETLLRSDIRISGFSVEWKTHWTRAMENMLDWPHLPFVHKATIGRSMRGQIDQRMDVAWEDRPWGAHTHIAIAGEKQPGSLDMRWPNQMNLHIPIPNKVLLMMVACVPIDQHTTRMLLVVARSFLRSPVFDYFFRRSNAKIALEDKAIVESSYPSEVPPAGEEKSVRTDGPTLQFRKRYFAELQGSKAEPSGAEKRALPVVE